MSLFKFIFSKVFLKQLLIAVVVLGLLIFAFMQWLKVSTNHGEYVTVPDISKETINEVKTTLEKAHLNFVVLDSTNYNPDYPRYSVIEQHPEANQKVKEGRKIYLTLNPSGYRKVSVPNLIQVTRRNAASMLKAVGLELGEVEYVDNIGKDMVLSLKHDGQEIQPGDMFPKTTKIDLVCGNGNEEGTTMVYDSIAPAQDKE
ncbi:PASTA domain-containing protein [Zhouia sp. PK063]|uniref:PASTA domain-containing protein n=1 Tax=Zhouia sp. PK063 TaxID=3373602 RepID=UPI0037B72E01